MNKTAKQQPTNNHKSKWTQQDAASKTYPRLKRRHKKQKPVWAVAVEPITEHRTLITMTKAGTPVIDDVQTTTIRVRKVR